MYKLPHKIIQELRSELEEVKRSCQQNSEFFLNGAVRRSKVESLQQEVEMKNKYIAELEGDMKQMKIISVSENMQYMRHTLVKFLCDSTKSEKVKIAPVVEQLLEMT